MKISNKTINYAVYIRDSGTPNKILDTTEVELPPIEFMTDSIKGSGILGEVDLPTWNLKSMAVKISLRASNEDTGALMSATDIELRWVTDVFDTNNIKTGVNAHKAFIKCLPKKLEEGKIAMGEASDGSLEFEAYAYKRTVNGKEIINIDKFNNVLIINGKNLLADVQSAL